MEHQVSAPPLVSTASPARWRVIAPFLKPLQRWADVSTRARDLHLQSDSLGLVLLLPVESSAQELQKFRVAIDLLRTLWALDRAAWRSAITEEVGIAMPASLVVPDAKRLPAPMLLVVSIKHDKFPWQLNGARWTALLQPHVPLDDGAARAKRRLLQNYGPGADEITLGQGAVPTPTPIPLRLQFLVFGLATKSVESYVTKLVDMVDAVQAYLATPVDAGVQNACAGLELQSVEVDVSPLEMTNNIAVQLMRLQSLGVQIHQLSVRLVRDEALGGGDVEDTTVRDRLLRSMLARRQNERGDGQALDVETLAIERADLVQFSAACAAMESTTRVKNLQLHNVFTFDTDDERRAKWASLACAVFSRRSRTSIKHVSINQGDFFLVDVANVATRLERDTAIQSDSEGEGHALESLAIGSEATLPETVEAIPLLVDQIGQHLKSLSVYLWMGHLTTRSVVDMLHSCRQLEFLDLSSVEIDSLDVILDAYAHGTCQIRTLALHNVEVPSVSVTRFAHALGDPTHKAANAIRQLCIDSVGVNNELDQANIDAFKCTVQTNRSLEYFEIRIPSDLIDRNRSAFEIQHGTWGRGVAARLPMSSKAAFLSALRPRCIGGTIFNQTTPAPGSAPMQRLDDDLVGHIFDLAADRVWRQVYVDEP